jgi:hypothetical protein
MKRSFAKRVSFGVKIGLSPGNARTLARLSGPEDIQDFVSAIPINFEPDGDTCRSAAEALKHRRAHCIEAAFIAAAALWMAGEKPLLMDMQAKGDSDHVIALFRQDGCWGAISKSNHVWLRWRDPVYKNLRELAMSYFHEYTNKRKKTMRAYSAAFDLRRFDTSEWVTNEKNCWDIAGALDECRHYKILTPVQARALKKRDDLEMQADQLIQYKKQKKG